MRYARSRPSRIPRSLKEDANSRLRKTNGPQINSEIGTTKSPKNTLSGLRATLGWSRNQLARLMNASDRAIVNWEAGDPISPVYAAKLREIQTIVDELKQLMKPSEIGSWLLTDMDEFHGHSPADLISKGEAGQLWASLFYLRSGIPD